MRLIGIRPEDPQQRIAPMGAWGPRHAQVREQRYALGLGKKRVQLTALGRPKLQSAEHPEIDHGCSLRRAHEPRGALVPNHVQGTAGKRCGANLQSRSAQTRSSRRFTDTAVGPDDERRTVGTV